MSWFTRFMTSSIGKKLVMSLTGLFLIIFLMVHLLGNLQLLNPDDGEAFNLYAHMMTTNPLIKFTSFGLYFFILLHAVQGLLIYFKNRAATGKKYAVSTSANATWASKNMALLGSLILIFLFIHMGDFWFAMKFGSLTETQTYDGLEVQDLYYKVQASFKNPLIVAVYLISMVGLAFHLMHGFASAFQTLGLNHHKYNSLIELVGKLYAIIVPLLFAIIPVFYYLDIRWPFTFHFI